MLSDQDKIEIVDLISSAMMAAGMVAGTAPDEEPDPIVPEPSPDEPDSGGPLAAASVRLGEVYQYLWVVNDFSAKLDNRFTRSDVYALAAEIIERGIAQDSEWIADSVPSWRFAAEAFRTRSSEILGDKLTTVFPLFTSEDQQHDFGVTEKLCNVMSLFLRRVVSQLQDAIGDRDLGPGGEVLTGGECVRITYNAIDLLTDSRIVPDGPDSAFMKVRKEMYNQYKAMGEGVFGPWANPGSPTAWSWAGQ